MEHFRLSYIAEKAGTSTNNLRHIIKKLQLKYPQLEKPPYHILYSQEDVNIILMEYGRIKEKHRSSKHGDGIIKSSLRRERVPKNYVYPKEVPLSEEHRSFIVRNYKFITEVAQRQYKKYDLHQEEMDDCVQRCFLGIMKILQRKNQIFESESHEQGFIVLCVKDIMHKYYKYLLASKRDTKKTFLNDPLVWVMQSNNNVEEDIISKVSKEELLNKIQPINKKIYHLYFEGYHHTDMAKVLGCTSKEAITKIEEMKKEVQSMQELMYA